MKTINGWTKEQMIAHVMFNFNGKSTNEDYCLGPNATRCLYRGPKETKCAVGMFIPDYLYEPSMDEDSSNSASSIIINFDLERVMPLEPLDMQILQRVHDVSNPDETLDAMIKWIEENVN